jgi:hypothetical protein
MSRRRHLGSHRVSHRVLHRVDVRALACCGLLAVAAAACASKAPTQAAPRSATTSTTSAARTTRTTPSSGATASPTALPGASTSTRSTGALSDGPLGRGIVPGRVTAVGDSVMLDYSAELEADVPGLSIEAAVGRQWLSGVALVRQLRAADRLGATVVVALGTNGPVTAGDLAAMMSALSGARRVVLVTVHVDRTWQAEVNTVLLDAARAYPNVVVADWAAVASQHPGWFYGDATHLPFGGAGARALAALVARAAKRVSTGAVEPRRP